MLYVVYDTATFGLGAHLRFEAVMARGAIKITNSVLNPNVTLVAYDPGHLIVKPRTLGWTTTHAQNFGRCERLPTVDQLCATARAFSVVHGNTTTQPFW